MKSYVYAIVLFVSILLPGCEDESHVGCDRAVFATVKDLTGLDGCGYVFELSDGTRLEPQMLAYCGNPPLPSEITENPLYNFQFVDGKTVRINYEVVPDAMSICMAGKIVKITCIEEVNAGEM